MIMKVLFVDDDPIILRGYKRTLGEDYDICTAEGGKEGLSIIEKEGKFAVIVSDMKMPGMDGIEFLSRAREKEPESVRIMLTGHADLDVTMDAVNEGNIFRFLTKPCSTQTMKMSLQAGIKQYLLLTSEKELLEKTLSGSVKVLTEILSLVNPTAFSKSLRNVKIVKYITDQMQLSDSWQFQLAAMLSQIGCITLPENILEKTYSLESLSINEKRMLSTHPTIAFKLLSNIPRLEIVSQIIKGQMGPFKDISQLSKSSEEYAVALGSQILKATLDYDMFLVHGMSRESALKILRKKTAEYNQDTVAILEKFQIDEAEKTKVLKTVNISNLRIGMIFDQDVLAKNGLLLASKGQEAVPLVLVRLRNFAQGIGVIEPINVWKIT